MKKLLLPGLAAIILLSAFAFTGEPDPIIGRWEFRSVYQGQPYSFLVVFRPNGHYDGFLDNKIFVSGHYRMNKDTLYIADPICNSNYYGTYLVKFMGRPDSIQFKVLQDTCRARREGADGFTFKKLSTALTDRQPTTPAALGRQLFFDPILSQTRKISCASCHKPAFAFADTSAVSLGIRNQRGVRNTPSVMNMKLQTAFFWDGRASSLEQQALMPIVNPIEMGLPIRTAVNRLNNNSFYAAAFQAVFHEAPSEHTLAKALAEFERTLETNHAPLDDWLLNDNENAVSEAAKRGYAIFNGEKAHCVQCHFGADFNTGEFRSIGLYDGRKLRDSGRAAITGNPADLGKFKIGALRNVAMTAPYMHNGMFKTLREVIDYYDDPDKVVPHAIGRDSLLAQPMHLTEQEKSDLESFLVALTDRRFNL